MSIVWLVCFILLWAIFTFLLPRNELKIQLNEIEESIVNKDWNKAKKSTEQFINTFNKKKAIIQMNNATEIYTNFQLVLGQLDSSVHYEQEAALEYVGALKGSIDLVIKAFSGP
jgi:hypothetical protein